MFCRALFLIAIEVISACYGDAATDSPMPAVNSSTSGNLHFAAANTTHIHQPTTPNTNGANHARRGNQTTVKTTTAPDLTNLTTAHSGAFNTNNTGLTTAAVTMETPNHNSTTSRPVPSPTVSAPSHERNRTTSVATVTVKPALDDNQNFLLWTVQTTSMRMFKIRNAIELARIDGDSLMESRRFRLDYYSLWALSFNWRRKLIYYSNYDFSHIGILDIRMNRVMETRIHDVSSGVDDIAVDYLTDNVYWIDSTMLRIFVSDMHLQKYRPVLTLRGEYPVKLTIDPHGRKLYWSELDRMRGESRIMRSGMNGESMETVRVIRNCRNIGGLSFDYSQDRLWWTENLENELGGKYTGIRWWDAIGNYTSQLGRINTNDLSGIVVLESHVYALDSDRQRILVLDKDQFTSGPKQQYHIEVGSLMTSSVPTSLIAYGRTSQPFTQQDLLQHPCHNHSCSDICVALSGTRHQCLCAYGTHLEEDGVSCRSRLYDDNFILAIDLLHGKLLQAPLSNHSLASEVNVTSGEVRAVEYDFAARRIYWSEARRFGLPGQIRSAKLDGSDSRLLVSSVYVQSMSIDHVSRNLYFVDYAGDYIGVMSLDSNQPDRYASFPSHDLHDLTNLVVGGTIGKVFWTDRGKTEETGFYQVRPTLESMNLDGSGRRSLYNISNYVPRGLTLDEKGAKLYWIGSRMKTIDWFDLKTGKSDSVPIRRISKERIYVNKDPHIAYHDGYLYVAGLEQRAFHRINVKQLHAYRSAATFERFGPDMLFSATYIRIYSSNHTSSGTNKCSVNRGNCSQVCLPSADTSQAKCACSIYYRMENSTCMPRTSNQTSVPRFVNCTEKILTTEEKCAAYVNSSLVNPPRAFDSLGQELPVQVQSSPPKAGKLYAGLYSYRYKAKDDQNHHSYCHRIVRVQIKRCGVIPESLYRNAVISKATCGNFFGSQLTVKCDDSNLSFKMECSEHGLWIAEENMFCPPTITGRRKVNKKAEEPSRKASAEGGFTTSGKVVLAIVIVAICLAILAVYLRRKCRRVRNGYFGMKYFRGDDVVPLTNADGGGVEMSGLTDSSHLYKAATTTYPVDC